jgi:hypothetical protein
LAASVAAAASGRGFGSPLPAAPLPNAAQPQPSRQTKRFHWDKNIPASGGYDSGVDTVWSDIATRHHEVLPLSASLLPSSIKIWVVRPVRMLVALPATDLASVLQPRSPLQTADIKHRLGCAARIPLSARYHIGKAYSRQPRPTSLEDDQALFTNQAGK